MIGLEAALAPGLDRPLLAPNTHIRRSDVTADEIVNVYTFISVLVTDHNMTGATSWPCIYETGEERVFTLSDIDDFMAKAVALHRCAE